jgi:hypothetical protein
MEQEDYKNEEFLTQKEDLNPTGLQTPTSGDGKTRPSRKKKADPDQTREDRKKKQDALEGKDNKSSRSSESDSSKGKGHNDSEKEDSSEKGGKASESGPQSHSNLQSGQTTVQFSSGGGAGSFGSLLALFSSSASLVRAEVIPFLNLSTQPLNLTLRFFTQQGSTLGNKITIEENKGSTNIINTGSNTSELANIKNVLDTGGLIRAHTSGPLDTIVSTLTNSISANASEGRGNKENIHTQAILDIAPLQYLPSLFLI